MNIKSNELKNNQLMDIKYSGYGQGLSPQLEWSSLPEGTKSLALFCHDPDAPIASGFWHGLVVNIPVDTTSVATGAWNKLKGLHKLNDGDTLGFTPPQPPKGTGEHRYNYTIYALPFEDINDVTKHNGVVTTAESSKAYTAFFVEMNKLDSATITFIDKYRG